jgi:DNA-directed RNA polymerase subunit RPC12/RpoP
VLLPEPPASPDEFWFGFFCPSCSGEVATREGDAGTYAVCPHCLVPLVIPHWGHYLEGAGPRPTHDPLDSLHASREVTCPACQARISARSPTCPVCGVRLASP